MFNLHVITDNDFDEYYVAYMHVLIIVIKMKIICYNSCMMIPIKSMSKCNEKMNYDKILIQ